MNVVVEVAALLSIFPIGVLLFVLVQPRRAMLATFMTGQLFLPVRGIDIAGPIDLEKQTVTALAVLLGVLLFDSRRLLAARPRLVDVPVAVLCLSPIATSVLNGLGAWDGMSNGVVHVMMWGIPWWMGRIYFRDRESLRELAIALVLGGLVYVPLCLWEVRFSPQLHNWVYGYTPRPFLMIKRYGGFRPMVFMSSSLMVGMWIALTAVLAWWLWRSGSVRRLFGVPMGLFVAALVVTEVLCKTMGALSLMLVGFALYELTRATGSRLFIVALALVAGLYAPVRTWDVVRTDQILAVAEAVYPEERVYSLYIRLINEDAVSGKAKQRLFFGWGGYGRARAKPVEGRPIVDGLWMITLGKYGLVGLLAVTFTYLLGAIRLLFLGRRRGYAGRAWAPALALAVTGVLYWVDSLSNAFVNSGLVVGLGAAAGARLRGRMRKGAAVEAAAAPGPAAPAPEPTEETPAASLGRGLRRPSGSRPRGAG